MKALSNKRPKWSTGHRAGLIVLLVGTTKQAHERGKEMNALMLTIAGVVLVAVLNNDVAQGLFNLFVATN